MSTQISLEGANPDRTGRHEPGSTSPQDGRRRLSKRGRRGRVIAVVVVVMVAAAGGAVYVRTDAFHAQPSATAASSGATTGLAQITKGNLAARSVQNGTLGYAGDHEVVNRASGTLTALPKVGDVVRTGKVLYRVDGKPVVLLKGAQTPVYRALSNGMEGADVQQLNAALVALGYTTSSKLDPNSDEFGSATYYALKKLQGDVGLDKTGQLELGQAVFVPTDEIRITKVDGMRGASAAPNQAVVHASSTERQVTVELRASQQTSVAGGDDVAITMPSGKTTPGKVSSVDKVATKDNDGNVTVEVLITPTKPEETGQLDQAPVQVSIVSETVKDVLSVPVNALMALAGGGYAVELVEAGGTHRLVAVKTGLFDDSAGRVEVSGEGLAVGQNVVVPAS